MRKIVSVTVIPNTQHPAIGSRVKVIFDDDIAIVLYQDTLLAMFNTDKESELIGKEWVR